MAEGEGIEPPAAIKLPPTDLKSEKPTRAYPPPLKLLSSLKILPHCPTLVNCRTFFSKSYERAQGLDNCGKICYIFWNAKRYPAKGAEGERELWVLKLSGKRIGVSKTSGETFKGHRRGKSVNKRTISQVQGQGVIWLGRLPPFLLKDE